MPVAQTLECRLLCASNCAYGIQDDGSLQVRQPYYDAVGFTAPPAPFVAGVAGINAALVGTSGDGVVLAFRGTLPPNFQDLQTNIDWVNDANAALIQVANVPGRVHAGFWGAIDSLWANVAAEVQRQLNAAGGANLYVTGHSKGGALAALAAWRLHADAIKTASGVYTYAAPRTADATFANAYDAVFQHQRYEFEDDIVPCLPPSGALVNTLRALGVNLQNLPLLEYESVGTLRFIDWSGQVVPDSLLLPARRLWSLVGRIIRGDFAGIARDHAGGCGGGYMSRVCPGVCP